MTDAAELPIETDVATVDAMRQRNETFVLLDVREEEEYALARIDGSLLIPMGQLRQRWGELEPYQDQWIVVHCHHGGRSLQVTQALRNSGFAKVQNMAGGIEQWSQQIDPSIARY